MPDSDMPRSLYIIAGEASGDFIGSELLHSLKQRAPDLTLNGIGGAQMQAQGLTSLFAMEELSLMGFAEILPHIRRLKRRIHQTVEDILARQPDLLVTIDSPGFAFRVVKQLRARGFRAPCVHYVAPTVWAYKPQRAAKTAALFDALLVLLPFEPPYFEAEGLETHFVGHPKAWYWRQHRGDTARFRESYGVAPDATLLAMMPGSRLGEVARHLPVFRETARHLAELWPGLEIAIPVTPNVEAAVRAQTQAWPAPVHIVAQEAHKPDLFAAADLALAKSGTVALETALAFVPTVTTFRANPLSIWLARRMVRIPYVNLMNIMAYFAQEPAPIPELIQENCRADKLAKALLALQENNVSRSAQLDAFAHYGAQLLPAEGEPNPSERAADILMRYLA